MRRFTSAAKSFFPRFHVHVEQIGGFLGPQAIFDSIVSGQVRTRLCSRDHVIRGDSGIGRGQGDLFHLGSQIPELIDGCTHSPFDIRIQTRCEVFHGHTQLELLHIPLLEALWCSPERARPQTLNRVGHDRQSHPGEWRHPSHSW